MWQYLYRKDRSDLKHWNIPAILFSSQLTAALLHFLAKKGAETMNKSQNFSKFAKQSQCNVFDSIVNIRTKMDFIEKVHDTMIHARPMKE